MAGWACPLPPGVLRKVHDTGLFEVIRGIGLDPVASLMAYSPSSEVEWTWVAAAQPWYPYHFSMMQICDGPER